MAWRGIFFPKEKLHGCGVRRDYRAADLTITFEAQHTEEIFAGIFVFVRVTDKKHVVY